MRSQAHKDRVEEVGLGCFKYIYFDLLLIQVILIDAEALKRHLISSIAHLQTQNKQIVTNTII